MNKKSQIVLGAIIGLIALIYGTYLFIIPNFIDLNTFKPQIQKAAKEATGLEIDPGNLKLSTFYDFSVKLTAENVKVDKYLKLEKASVRVLLPALLFKKIELEEIRLNKPEIFITRLKNGKYDIENALQPQQQPQSKPQQATGATKSRMIEKPTTAFEPEFSGMEVYISDYEVNMTDLMGAKPRNFALKGDLLEISKFKPDRYIKIATNGKLLVENNPNINFDIKLATELPLVKQAENNQSAEEHKNPDKATKTQAQPQTLAAKDIDPIEKLLKYDPKIDVIADLKIKSREKFPEINGKVSFDRLSLNIDGQKLPESNGNFEFKGKKIKLDSKLYITPTAYFQVAGDINDLAGQDFDINVKSTDIDLKDVRKFAYSLADAANADISALNDISLAGNVIADFNLKKDNYTGFLNVVDTTISHKLISQPLKNLSSTLNFSRDRVVFEQTSGSIGDVGFEVNGYVNSKLYSDIKISFPRVNLKTVYDILNTSRMFADLKPQLKEISYLKGDIVADVLIKGQLDKLVAPVVKAKIGSISLFHEPSGMPIAVRGGELYIDEKGVVKFKKIITQAANTPLVITGHFQGDANKWNVHASSPLANVEYIKGSNNLIFNANGDAKTVNLTKTGIYSGSNEVLSVNGSIVNGTDLKDLKVVISGLGVNIPEPKGLAEVSGNLLLSGKVDAPKALGVIKLTNLDIPSLKFKSNDIAIGLKNEAITITTGVLSIVDSKIKLAADLQNKLTPPYVVNTITVESDFINLDNLSLALQQQPSAGQKTQQYQNTAPAARTTSVPGANIPTKPQQQPDVPLIINSGKFFAKELIVSNLKNTNTSFDFTIRPLNQLAIRNFRTSTAGGLATGLADMNLKTSKLGLDFTADNIEINALATELAKMPNEVFGAMKGRIQLSTIGQTPDAMTQNAIGKVDFTINNGHLGKLGDLAYLLKTVKIGNMESLNTNQFESMTGHILVNRGILDVQEIKMQGKRMSSFIKGSIRIRDSYAELTLLNKLSGKIVSQLGFIKDLSISKLSQQLPGQWGALLNEFAAQAQITGNYSNRDRIPGLLEEPHPEDKDFAVTIKGELGKSSSVRMIEWLE